MTTHALSLSQAIRAARIERGLTQGELASRIGVSQGTISFWENGAETPTIEHVITLALELPEIVESFDGREHQRVLAIDVDANPNLALSLGVPRERAARMPAVPHGLTEWREDAEGKAYVHLRQPIPQFIADYGVPAPDGVQLLVMGQVLEA